jgi:large subunit ribosomal protein L19
MALADSRLLVRVLDRKTKQTRSAFAVYPPTGPELSPIHISAAITAVGQASAATADLATNKNSKQTISKSMVKAPPAYLPILKPAPKKVLEAFSASQIALRDPTGARTTLFSRANKQAAHVGDVLMVTQRRGGEPFSGVLISIRRAGIDTAILLRSQVTKVAVEMWYKVYSSKISGIEIVWRRPKRARRARLTYMRKPKHDMGSVEHLVTAWRRSRRVLGSRTMGSGGAKGQQKKQAGGSKKK